jgi:molybdate/tungstate transport system substrate-binding protein
MKRTVLLVFAALVIFFGACRSSGEDNTLRIIHAGSLSLVVKDVVEAYLKEYPDVRILTESWGSKDGARQITELNKPCDVYISADDRIIEAFLFPDHATWGIPFAGNEMVIAYTDASRYSDIFNSENWYEVLARRDVYTARSSPDADPCGVRAVLVMLLSDFYYDDASISERLIAKDHNFIRPKEADLIAMLQKRSVDYLYLYRSMAEQHGFRYLRLSDSVNLRNPDMAEFYRKAAFETVGSSPGSTHREVGAPIVYGITIPSGALNPELAEDFIAFMLDPARGGKIIEHHGQHLLPPQPVMWYERIPESLQHFVLRQP